MVGKGANGKVYWPRLCLVAGYEKCQQCQSLPPFWAFRLDALPGSLNISTENELGDKYLNTESFKAITGSDVVNVEQKSRRPLAVGST